MACGCGSTSKKCVQFEPDVLEWLKLVGGVVDLKDACTNQDTGVCVTSLSSLVRALQALAPAATTTHEYVAAINAVAGLSRIGTWLQALAAATVAEKAAVKAAVAACVRSGDAGNTLTIGTDAGLLGAAIEAGAVADLLAADAPAMLVLAGGLISGDAGNSLTLGSDQLLFENDGV